MTDPTPWIVAEDTGAVRKHAPATLRNRTAIADILAEILPDSGTVLEIASGSGEHCAFFAERFAALDWQPTDPAPDALASIASWCEGLANVSPPLAIDASAPDWPVARVEAVLCINMIHISPWEATLGLMAGAGRLLGEGAPLILYGPFRREAVATSESNAAFDVSLKSRDSRWGLRSLEAVTAIAEANGLLLERVIEMPANNLSVVYRR